MAEQIISSFTMPDENVMILKDATARTAIANLTYTLSISNNVITLTGSKGDSSSITLPVYDGGVSE